MNASFGLTRKTLESIRLVFSRHAEVRHALLFGSRAKGTYKPGSDIDLALYGDNLTTSILNRLYEELDELPIPHEFSLVLWSKILDPEIAAHIERAGVLFYQRTATAEIPLR